MYGLEGETGVDGIRGEKGPFLCGVAGKDLRRTYRPEYYPEDTTSINNVPHKRRADTMDSH